MLPNKRTSRFRTRFVRYVGTVKLNVFWWICSYAKQGGVKTRCNSMQRWRVIVQ